MKTRNRKMKGNGQVIYTQHTTMSSVYFPHEINASSISFSEPKPFGETGAKIVYANCNNKEIKIQCPVMTSPYGLGVYDDGSRKKYSIDLSFRGEEENTRIAKLHEVLKEIDAHVLEHAVKNSVVWFKKKMSKEVLQELMTPSVKYSKDKETGEITDKYPPTFKIKVPFYEERFTKPVFHLDTKEPIENADWNTLVTKGVKIQAIVQHSGIWFAGGKFGSMWQVYQMKIQPSEKLTSYSFRDEDEPGESGESPQEEQGEEQEKPVEYVLDSEDEL